MWNWISCVVWSQIVDYFVEECEVSTPSSEIQLRELMQRLYIQSMSQVKERQNLSVGETYRCLTC